MHLLTDPLYGDEDTVEHLGGKGKNLRVLSRDLGLNVPPAFTIPIELSQAYNAMGEFNVWDSWFDLYLWRTWDRIASLEYNMGRSFGGIKPLLLSVRSGAARSMPGMMDTILNLGLNDMTVLALAKETNEGFAWDSYRRFLQMYGTTVMGVDKEKFSQLVRAAETFSGGKLTVQINKLLVKKFKGFLPDFPQDVREQVKGAMKAVFDSWMSERAVAYREAEGIEGQGTAITVQAMVFGNLNDRSGTGVVFSRNPNTGVREYYGDFLINAQGEDVVSGEAHTLPFDDIRAAFPGIYRELVAALDKMEAHFKDMVDVEFTIEDGKLWILQVRVGKRGYRGAIRMAMEMWASSLISPDDAVNRIVAAAPSVQIANAEVGKETLITTGLPASSGRATGKVAMDSETAVKMAAKGENVILVRLLTDPSDTVGMIKSIGILTQTGGLVSHAAVVARGWNKPCVVGAPFEIHSYPNYFMANGVKVQEGDTITIDGDTGEVFA